MTERTVKKNFAGVSHSELNTRECPGKLGGKGGICSDVDINISATKDQRKKKQTEKRNSARERKERSNEKRKETDQPFMDIGGSRGTTHFHSGEGAGERV